MKTKRNTNNQKLVSISVDFDELTSLDIYCDAIIRMFKNKNSNKAKKITGNAYRCKNHINRIYNTKLDIKGYDFTKHEIYLIITEKEWFKKIKNNQTWRY